MKYLYCLLFLAFGNVLNAQTKDDLVAALKVIFEQPEMERAFQNDLSEGMSVVIQVENNLVRSNSNLTTKLMAELTQDDFWDFDRSVKLLVGESPSEYGVKEEYLMQITFNGDDKSLRFFLSSIIREERKQYQWLYTMNKDFSDWEVQNSDVSSRGVRLNDW